MRRPAKSSTKSKSAPDAVAAVQRLAKTAKKAQSAAKRAQRARCEELLALIARRKAEAVEAFYDMGEALREIHRKKLYTALGYTSFEQLLSERSVMSVTQASKLMKIVEHTSRSLALKLGQERAFALVGYVEATEESDTVEEIVKSERKIAGVPAAKASKRALEQEAKKLRDAKPKSAKQKAVNKAHQLLQRRLSAMLKANGLSKVTLEPQHNGVSAHFTYQQLEKLPE